jgi:hypothetical protein
MAISAWGGVGEGLKDVIDIRGALKAQAAQDQKAALTDLELKKAKQEFENYEKQQKELQAPRTFQEVFPGLKEGTAEYQSAVDYAKRSGAFTEQNGTLISNFQTLGLHVQRQGVIKEFNAALKEGRLTDITNSQNNIKKQIDDLTEKIGVDEEKEVKHAPELAGLYKKQKQLETERGDVIRKGAAFETEMAKIEANHAHAVKVAEINERAKRLEKEEGRIYQEGRDQRQHEFRMKEARVKADLKPDPRETEGDKKRAAVEGYMKEEFPGLLPDTEAYRKEEVNYIKSTMDDDKGRMQTVGRILKSNNIKLKAGMTIDEQHKAVSSVMKATGWGQVKAVKSLKARAMADGIK